MEGVVLEDSAFSIDEGNNDFCNSIITRFGNSTNDDHQHLCAVIGAMSQELKDHNLPSTPVSYFGAVCSSLDPILSEPNPPNDVVVALLTILSLVITRTPNAVLLKKREFLAELVARVLQSPSVAESALIPGLKCLSHLLSKRDSVSWSDVAQLFNIMLRFLTDSRPKVRRQSHLCLYVVLSSFQNSPLQASASEGVTSLFEKFLLLAGGANADAGEGTKGAQQVLYILDALKESLPLMSPKYKTNVLKYFKTLLDLRQPLVTRRITDGLNFLCLYPKSEVKSEVSPEALLELLTSLALFVSTNETSGDGMTSTARLLDAGMKKVYTLNRQICVVKLPLVFNALKDILASEHEEAIYAATDALKSLISSCIDETLIKQGVDQISLNVNKEPRRSGPTIIEKICATIESLLDYHYTAVWDRVFQVVSAMFRKLGDRSPYFVRGILKNLEDVQKLPDEDFPFRKQLHKCLGSALVTLGPEAFLSLIPLNLEAEDLSDTNIWLFPILKQHTVSARISFFTEEILSMIGSVREKSQKLEKQGLMVSSRNADAIAYSLWSLLPSFCNYPLDTAESFLDLVTPLCVRLEEEPDIRGIICTSLQLLIQQNKSIVDGENKDNMEQDIAEEGGRVHYSHQVATDNLNVLRSSAWDLFTAFKSVFSKATKYNGGCLQRTIGDIASISDKAVVSSFFKDTMQELLKATKKALEEAIKAENAKKSGNSKKAKNAKKAGNAKKADNAKKAVNAKKADNAKEENNAENIGSVETDQSDDRAWHLDFAISLLPGLNAKEIDLLFITIKPLLQDHEHVLQKKAYKVLSIILRNSDGFVASKFEELVGLMVEILPSFHFSAKHYRLDCLYFLVVHVSKSKDNLQHRWPEIVGSFLTEIILALKEANKKTRNRAYDILVQIGHASGDELRGGNREKLYQFFNMVAGGLAGETPLMISAAAKGLARLAYEFSDLVLTAFNLLPSTFLLLQRKNREIIKANLGLLKVLVAKSQAEGLQMHLRSMVEGLLRWPNSTKNHFQAKVKLLLEMLVTKCGLEAVKAVMPEEHMKLLSNIRKIKERKERRQGAKSEEARSHLSKATTSRQSKWNHTNFFSDFGDEDSGGSDADYLNAKTFFRGGKSSLHLRSAASSFRSNIRLEKNLLEHLSEESDDEPLDLLDRQKTRSALRSSEHLKRKSRLDDEVELDSEGRMIIRDEGEWRTEKSSEPDFDIRSEPDSHLSAKSGTKAPKRRKTSDSGWAYTGKEYASKKAGGDLKRKDKLEPYAYWPLDRKMMSRRPQQRAAARKGMASAVKMTKRLEGKSASSVLSVSSLKLKRTQRKGARK